MKLELHESMLFSNGRQWARDFNYTGYGFEEETVEPGKPRKIGWIWINEKWPIKELMKDDNYMTVIFKDEEKKLRRKLVLKALGALQTEVDGQKVFED